MKKASKFLLVLALSAALLAGCAAPGEQESSQPGRSAPSGGEESGKEEPSEAPASSDASAETPDSPSDGEQPPSEGGEVEWALEGSTLTVTGSGPIGEEQKLGWVYFGDQVETIIIEPGITEIGEAAFYKFVTTDVTIPGTVTAIGDNAFCDNDSLKTIAIPEGVTKIGEETFNNCSILESVSLPDTVTEIGYAAFSACKKLTGFTFPKDITGIRDYTFAYCESLSGITLPEGLTYVGKAAFQGCALRQGIVLPSGVQFIHGYSFKETGITSVTIPKGVVLIGVEAFNGCESLADVYFAGSEAEWEKIQIEEGNEPLLSANIHYNSTGE